MIFFMTLQLLKMTSTTSSLFAQDAFGIGGMPTLTSRMNRKVGIWEKQHSKQDRKCHLKLDFLFTYYILVLVCMFVLMVFINFHFDEPPEALVMVVEGTQI